MNIILAGLAMVAVGIDVGYQPLPKGGAEYIIQIEPHTLESLQPGEEMESYLPPEAREVRPERIRVVIGKNKLPKELPPKLAIPSPTAQTAQRPVVSPFGRGLQSYMTAKNTQGPLLAPGPLNPDPASRPIPERQAGFIESTPKSEGAAATGGTAANADKEKPWLPLMAAMVVLCASLAGNAYLGWIFWDTRGRYQALLIRDARPGRLPRGNRQSADESPEVAHG